MKQFDMSNKSSDNQYLGMTHYVDLPTKGQFYHENHPLFGVDSLEIKMLTTKEEDILTNQSYIENNIAIEKLLQSIILVDVDPKEIHDADQTAILIAARIEAYGEDYEVDLVCENCGSVYQHNIDLDSFNLKESTVEVDHTPGGTLLVELPKSKKVVEFKHLMPKEIGAIQKTVEKMTKLNINTTFNSEFYKRIVLSVDGEQDKEAIAAFLQNLRILDSRKLLAAYTDTIPALDTSYKSTCTNCNHVNEGGLPIQASFFFPKF
jgi:hypothetical protein